ncbi:hypothetical protein OPIT5_27505 [Opitutaceae bacterium TAV5]|nr:hypothetical protein OPIT5_27505 [Opitutaceae bacterium TAV5]
MKQDEEAPNQQRTVSHHLVAIDFEQTPHRDETEDLLGAMLDVFHPAADNTAGDPCHGGLAGDGALAW